MSPILGSPTSSVKSRDTSPTLPTSPRHGNRPAPIQQTQVSPSASSANVADNLVGSYIPRPDAPPVQLQGLGQFYSQNSTPKSMDSFSAAHHLQYSTGSGSHESSPAVQSITLPQIQNNGMDDGNRSFTPVSGSSSYGVNSPPPAKRPAFSGNRAFNANTSAGAGANCSESSFFYRSPNPAVRQRTAQACEKCRDRKTKCSGTRPTCKRCADRGLICVWAPETRSRGSNNLSKNRLQRKAETTDNIAPSPPTVQQQIKSPAPSQQLHRPPPLTLNSSTHYPQLNLPNQGDRPATSRPDQPIRLQMVPNVAQAPFANSIGNLLDPNVRYAMTPQQRSLAEAAARAVASGTMTAEEAWQNLMTVVREQAQERAMVANAMGQMQMQNGFVPSYMNDGYIPLYPEEYGHAYDYNSNNSSPPSATSSHFSIASSRSSATDYDQHMYANALNAPETVNLNDSMYMLNFPQTSTQTQFDHTPRPRSTASFTPTQITNENMQHPQRINISGTAESLSNSSSIGGNTMEYPFVDIDFSLISGQASEKMELTVPPPHAAPSPPVTESATSATSSPASVSTAPMVNINPVQDEELVAQFINTDVAYGGLEKMDKPIVQGNVV